MCFRSALRTRDLISMLYWFIPLIFLLSLVYHIAITQLYNLNPSNNAHAGRAVGATFVILSIVFLYMANARYFHSQVALTKDHFPASRGAILFGSTAVLAVLIAMFVLIIIDQKHR